VPEYAVEPWSAHVAQPASRAPAWQPIGILPSLPRRQEGASSEVPPRVLVGSLGMGQTSHTSSGSAAISVCSIRMTNPERLSA
jgi:hypothetical protein